MPRTVNGIPVTEDVFEDTIGSEAYQAQREAEKNEFLQKVKGDCRYCDNMVDIRPKTGRGSRTFVGGCRLDLHPETCGRWELAQCFRD